MTNIKRRDMLRGVGGVVIIGGLAGCTGGNSGGGDSTGNETTTAMDTNETTSTPTPESGMAMVRVAHLSPDAPNVDVYVDGSVALSDVPFGAVSDYLSVPTGTRSVKVTAAGDESTVAFEGDVEVEEATYTVAAVGELGEGTFQPLILEDDVSIPSDEMARVRVVHASPDAPAVDITTGGQTLFDGVEFTQSGTAEVPADTYTIEVRGDTESNDGDAVAEFDVQLASGTVYTIFAAGYLSPPEMDEDAEDGEEMVDKSFRPIVTIDAGEGGGGLLDVFVRAAHLSPDAPNVDVLVDGTAVLTDVPFGAVSDYLSLAAGMYQVTIQATGDPETVVFDEELDLMSGAYTVAAIGELAEGAANPFEVVILEDDRSAPADDMARIRVFHASPDAPAVDVTVKSADLTLVDGAAFGDTATVEVAAGEYTLEIRGDTESNDGDVVAEFDVAPEGGRAYTAIAQGYLAPPEDASDDVAFDLQVVADN
ncbi:MULTISPECIES: DUF4397 domain-containing protein [Haloferax]|uniref:DUF4397 domain-containing protein n=2 Tax=Haloferax TaxID=2251 RepID=A0A6G1Z3I1_9EURY|nr:MULTISPECIES: DUF4397 domain-containing protein [Haloferax]KAB1188414.1 DUF4397 domain-containing protein [Haloferax sp. CBA1149]MRW81106.1 DUF4397 domain-containing protein [Haloferax marinisediminis]